jgi:uncharacterized membrane protein YczE
MVGTIDLLKRFFVYCVGLLVLALGVAFSINSNLGVSPVNSLPYVLSLITNLNLGLAVTLVFSLYLVLQVLIERRDFKWINLTQLLATVLFGYFVDFTKTLLGTFSLPTYFGQLTMLGISIVLMAIGLSIYLAADLVVMPIEGLTLTLHKRRQDRTFGWVKSRLDTSVVIIGVALSFAFLGDLQGIREGTVLSALLIGRLMPWIKRLTGPPIERFMRKKEQSPKPVELR